MNITEIAEQIRQQRGLQPAEVVELLRAIASTCSALNAHTTETKDIVQSLDDLSDDIEDCYCPPMTDEERDESVADRMKGN